MPWGASPYMCGGSGGGEYLEIQIGNNSCCGDYGGYPAMSAIFHATEWRVLVYSRESPLALFVHYEPYSGLGPH